MIKNKTTTRRRGRATDEREGEANRTVVVPLEDERRARAVGGALGVDKELQPRVVRKTVTTRERENGDGWEVVATFEASELKALRSAVSGYYDLLTVSVRTVEAFEEDTRAGGADDALHMAVLDSLAGCAIEGAPGGVHRDAELPALSAALQRLQIAAGSEVGGAVTRALESWHSSSHREKARFESCVRVDERATFDTTSFSSQSAFITVSR